MTHDEITAKGVFSVITSSTSREPGLKQQQLAKDVALITEFKDSKWSTPRTSTLLIRKRLNLILIQASAAD
ncbi:MAG: hypothetical protein PHZ02_13585 [Desulfocapsaceae bacterium]|nr:hypothetical protein [Desulfocapsaceae bacterium]